MSSTHASASSPAQSCSRSRSSRRGALSGAGGTDRPFEGSLVGEAWWVPDSTCPLGFRTLSEGSGVASHLGSISMVSDHCFALPNLDTGGHQTFVAANGDELHMTYEGTSDPAIPVPGDVITVTADVVIVGGTGRFAHATGEADLIALVMFTGLGVHWPFTWTWEGTISY
jgi:hypothetical protein